MGIKSVSVRELRPELPKVMADIYNNLSRYVITRRGKPEVVMLSVEDFEALIETVQAERKEKSTEPAEKPLFREKPTKGRTIEDIKEELGIV